MRCVQHHPLHNGAAFYINQVGVTDHRIAPGNRLAFAPFGKHLEIFLNLPPVKHEYVIHIRNGINLVFKQFTPIMLLAETHEIVHTAAHSQKYALATARICQKRLTGLQRNNALSHMLRGNHMGCNKQVLSAVFHGELFRQIINRQIRKPAIFDKRFPFLPKRGDTDKKVGYRTRVTQRQKILPHRRHIEKYDVIFHNPSFFYFNAKILNLHINHNISR